MGKVMRVFLDTDMRCGHDALSEIAKSGKVGVKKLQPGDYVVFINTAQDRIKILTQNNVVGYYRHPSGRIDMSMLQYIPEAFGAKGEIDMEEATRKMLVAKLKLREPASQDAKRLE